MTAEPFYRVTIIVIFKYNWMVIYILITGEII